MAYFETLGYKHLFFLFASNFASTASANRAASLILSLFWIVVVFFSTFEQDCEFLLEPMQHKSFAIELEPKNLVPVVVACQSQCLMNVQDN